MQPCTLILSSDRCVHASVQQPCMLATNGSPCHCLAGKASVYQYKVGVWWAAVYLESWCTLGTGTVAAPAERKSTPCAPVRPWRSAKGLVVKICSKNNLKACHMCFPSNCNVLYVHPPFLYGLSQPSLLAAGTRSGGFHDALAQAYLGVTPSS